MICKYCGATINDNAKFCTNCGKLVEIEQTPAPDQGLTEDLTQTTVQQTVNTAPAPAPAPVYTAPAPAPAPTYTTAQPSQNTVYAVRPSAPPRDLTGKYILKRAIFCAIALVLGIIISIVLKPWSVPGGSSRAVRADMVFMRLTPTLILIFVPLIAAFIIGILTGLARNSGAKNVIRIISAVLRSLVPFAFGLVLMYFIAYKLALLPIAMMNNSYEGLILPILSLFFPLTGYFMDAAVNNGHRESFPCGVAAVAAFAADKMPLIILAEIFAEIIFSVPGIGYLTLHAVMTISSDLAAVMITYVVIIYLLRLLFDIIAAAASKGDPAPQVYASSKDKKDGNGILIVGLILAGITIMMAAVLPFLTTGNPSFMNPADMFLAPGKNGHILGTDGLGRDFFTQLAFGLRNTVIVALVNVIIGIIFGAIFGVLQGFLKGIGSDIFKCIAYLFGHGTFFAILLFIAVRIAPEAPFIIVGLFGWGSIAGRIAGAIKTKKSSPKAKTSFIIPVLTQVVQLFCSAVIFTSGLSAIGLAYVNPSFPTLGYVIANNLNSSMRIPHLILMSTGVLIIMLFSFYMLHAGLSAKEKRNY